MAPPDGEPGSLERIGPYKLIEVIGKGRQGTVYLAQQLQPVRRRVAIKLFNDALGGRDSELRFQAERRALERMSHSNIARVFDSGTTSDGRPYFALEYVHGVDVVRYCDENRLTVRERLAVFQQICHAVQHAHQRGIIHRDLKPGNVLVTVQDDQPIVKVLDFGLARAVDGQLVSEVIITEEGRILGTPEYMSPEQAGMSALDIDTRTDVYSLGVILYELLVGELPFSSRELRQAGLLEMQRIIREVPAPRPSTRISQMGDGAVAHAQERRTTPRGLHRLVSRDLEWITMKCLEKDRVRRYAGAISLSEDLDRFLNGDAVIAGPPSSLYLFRKWLGRHRAAVATVTTLFISVVAGLIVSLVFYFDAVQAREETQRLADDLLAERYIAQVEDLYPEVPRMIPAMEAWGARVDTLLGRLPDYRRALAEQGERQLDPAALSRLVERLEGLESQVAIVDDRIAWANRIRVETLEEPMDTWKQVSRDLESDPRFLFPIPPQVGLIPIRRDPKTRLWEFVHRRSGLPPAIAADGSLEITGETGLVFVLVPGKDDFLMGSQYEDESKPNYDPISKDKKRETPPHKKKIRAFFVAKYEMTQKQWERFTGRNPSLYKAQTWMQWSKKAGLTDAFLASVVDLIPVDRVSWRECDKELRRLDLRLPTEPEWEYASRADSPTRWPTGNSPAGLHEYANLADPLMKQAGITAQEYTDVPDGFPACAPVNAYRPNDFGLHNTLGNLWEWTADSYREYPDKRVMNENEKVFRGGCYFWGPTHARHTHRFHLGAENRSMDTGVRPARDLRLD